MKQLYIILFSFFLYTTISAQDKTRGSKVVTENENVVKGENYILAIGIDDYENWGNLDNAVNDASGIHSLFTEQLGFKALSKPLLNQDATKKSILSFIENQLPDKITPNDNLIIFFSGHGESYERKIGTKQISIGYIIPQDADNSSKNNFNSYIKADELMSKVNELPAKHILLILDACKSGIAVKTDKWRNDLTYSEDLRSRMSRKVITSAMADQVAADNGPIANHSLFTGTLIEGFKSGMIDKGDRNGILTTSEIGLYLQQLVAQNSKATVKQTPDFGSFGFDDRGEMIIDLNDDSLFTLKSRLNGAMQSGKLTQAWKVLGDLVKKYPEDPEIDYFHFRKALYNNDIDKAITHIDKLQEFIDGRDSKYYLSNEQAWDLKQQLPYWKEILKTNKTNKGLKINVLTHYPDEVKCNEINENSLMVNHKITDSESDIDYHKIKPKSCFQFEFENLTDENQYLYFFYFDFNGSFNVVRFLNNYKVIDYGIPLKSKVKSLLYQQDGAVGLEKISVYSSPERIRVLESPLSPASRSSYKLPDDISSLDIKRNDVFLLFN